MHTWPSGKGGGASLPHEAGVGGKEVAREQATQHADIGLED